MTVQHLLASQAKRIARGRAARLGGRVALAGAALVALALLLARMGFPVPLVSIPEVAWLPRFLGIVAVSFAGLVQGVALLVSVFLLAWIVRRFGALVLRRGVPHTARLLDRELRTDRFSAALEAGGPFRPLVERYVLAHPPGQDTLAPAPPGRLHRWLRRLLVLLVLLVAFSPGAAPGEPGFAPVAGDPEGGTRDNPLVLKLLGESRTFGPLEPVMVQVVAEITEAPERDLRLDVRLSIDGGEERDTKRRLFLPAGAAGEDAVAFDLKRYARGLEPGEHRAVARAGDAESNEYRFTIESPPGGESPKPSPEPDERDKPEPPGGSERGSDPELEQKFVEPLVREGEKVRKKARVPIEVPGGAPSERTLEEAWPELQRRKEAALNRPGLSPHARQLVREYFDRLRPREQGSEK